MSKNEVWFAQIVVQRGRHRISFSMRKMIHLPVWPVLFFVHLDDRLLSASEDKESAARVFRAEMQKYYRKPEETRCGA